jgi:hypothetical protein
LERPAPPRRELWDGGGSGGDWRGRPASAGGSGADWGLGWGRRRRSASPPRRVSPPGVRRGVAPVAAGAGDDGAGWLERLAHVPAVQGLLSGMLRSGLLQGRDLRRGPLGALLQLPGRQMLQAVQQLQHQLRTGLTKVTPCSPLQPRSASFVRSSASSPAPPPRPLVRLCAVLSTLLPLPSPLLAPPPCSAVRHGPVCHPPPCSHAGRGPDPTGRLQHAAGRARLPLRRR